MKKRYGFGFVLMIECECGSCNEVSTGKTHRTGKRRPAVLDVNTKAALGVIWYSIVIFKTLKKKNVP